MAGRPINEDRQIAIELGLKTYTGSVHSKCGTTERYVAGGGCVHCGRAIATEQRDALKYQRAQAAKLDGRGDQGSYPSSQGPLDNEPDDGLDAQRRREADLDELM